MRLFSFTTVLATAAVAAGAAEPKPPLELAPSSNWNVNYADDSCRLARIFGEGENRIWFSIDRFEPGDEFLLMIAGSPLKDRDASRSLIRFGPASTGEIDGLADGSLINFAPAFFGTAKLVNEPALELTRKEWRKAASDPSHRLAAMQYAIPPAVEAAISWIEVSAKGKRPIRLRLGPMDKPMAALRACNDELLTHWGIDVAAHRDLSRPATPANNPGEWLSSGDYPAGLLAQGTQGLVQVRMSVGPDGSATQCHIQQSTRPAGFDEAVCKGLMRKARFEPALGAAGNPIASFWRTTVRFDIP